MKSKRTVILLTIALCALVIGMAACAPKPNDKGSPEHQAAPQKDSFGVIVSDEWAQYYPNQYKSYKSNEQNSPEGKHDYLELYPALRTMYKGYGFAKGYDEAAGHTYALESVRNTPRVNEKTTAACITCKTPQFTAMVNANGDSVYAQPFYDLIDSFTEPISCYNCHENDPKQLKPMSMFFQNSLGPDASKVPLEVQVCGQCHNEYYFNPSSKATMNPYVGLEAATPDNILAYYDERNFKDWEHPDTGAPMLKVQHPEFETIYGGEQTHMAHIGFTCSDCHMGTTRDENGVEYTSHYWVSPLENADLMSYNCSTCHDDLEKQVRGWQDESERRVHAISQKIETYINKVAEAKKNGTLTGADLEKAQYLHRKAQFYWDFVMVENSEGAHNPKLSTETLDKAEAAVDEGLRLVS